VFETRRIIAHKSGEVHGARMHAPSITTLTSYKLDHCGWMARGVPVWLGMCQEEQGGWMGLFNSATSFTTSPQKSFPFFKIFLCSWIFELVLQLLGLVQFVDCCQICIIYLYWIGAAPRLERRECQDITCSLPSPGPPRRHIPSLLRTCTQAFLAFSPSTEVLDVTDLSKN